MTTTRNHSGTPAQHRTPGPTDRERRDSRVRAALADMDDANRRGDVVMAGQARRTIDELCNGSLPQWVRDELATILPGRGPRLPGAVRVTR